MARARAKRLSFAKIPEVQDLPDLLAVQHDSFSWFLDGYVSKGFGRGKLYETAAIAMGRRGAEWTPAQEAMWEEIFKITAEPRMDAIKKGRRALRAQRS